jgi:hypothetical protein
MTNRQPWCMGSGRQVGVAHSLGDRVGMCTWCGRTELQINQDGTLRYHVAVLLDDLKAMGRLSNLAKPARPSTPSTAASPAKPASPPTFR